MNGSIVPLIIAILIRLKLEMLLNLSIENVNTHAVVYALECGEGGARPTSSFSSPLPTSPVLLHGQCVYVQVGYVMAYGG